MQGIFRKENTDKALKYGIYRHLPTYEKIIRNLVSFFYEKVVKWCKYSPGSSIYGYGKDCSETICAIENPLKMIWLW